MSFLFDRLISPFFEILRGNYYVPRSDWRLEAVQLQLQSEKKSLQHRVANSDWKWLTILRPKKPKRLKFEDKKDWQEHMCTCNYMYTNHRKHYINNYMEVNCKDYWEYKRWIEMKGIQRNFVKTVQVKELEESLEKIKTQMEEARRARRQALMLCLRDLAGSCACFRHWCWLCLSIRYYTWAWYSVEVYIWHDITWYYMILHVILNITFDRVTHNILRHNNYH